MPKTLITTFFFSLIFFMPGLAQDKISASGDAEVITSSPIPIQGVSTLKTPQFNDYDPGDSVEGDYIRGLRFFDNGKRLLAANFITNNLTVIDWQNQIPIADIPLAGQPMYVDVVDDLAVVSLPLDDLTQVISLDSNKVIATLLTPGEPNRVHIDPNFQRAFVSSVDSQRCYVVDLNSLSLQGQIQPFFSGIQTFSFITSNNRSDFDYYDFRVSPSGDKLVGIAPGGVGIAIYDVPTLSIDTVFSQISNPFSLGMADSAVAFVLNNESTPAIYQIDLTQNSIDSISLVGQSIFSFCRNIASDPAGDQVIMGLGSGIVKADFGLGNTSQVSTNTIFWLEPSFDKQYAVGGGFYTQIVDIAAGSRTSLMSGLSQSKGAVADSGYHFAGVDPLRKEYLHSYDFSNPASILQFSDVPTGSEFEADAPYRVAVSDSGNKVLVSNQLSKFTSIIDTDSGLVQSLVPGQLTGSFGCAVTSDGKYGVVSDYEGLKVHVIHMETGTIVASPTVGDRPSIVRIGPGDTLALVTNTRANTVNFVKLDSANSANLGVLSVGTIGVSWTNQGIFSDLQISPKGDYALVATSFDDIVRVIDLQTRVIFATLSVGDFPTQIAFDTSGSFAAVINKNDDSWSHLFIDGAFSSVLGTYNTSSNPTRIDYNPHTNQFLISNSGSQSVQTFDGVSGALVGTNSFGPNFTPIQVKVLYSGRIAYLLGASGSNTQSVLRIDNQDYNLPARPCYMDAANGNDVVAVAMSGPDFVSVYRDDTLLTTTSIRTYGAIRSDLTVYPNPSQESISIRGINENAPYALFDLQGKRLDEGILDGRKLDVSRLVPGVYFLQLEGKVKRKINFVVKE